uniref:NADH:ubiquinone reductase (H(+)-translocating) n=1 Tax=Paratenuisentis ambiguus TaxID=185730 RepID=K0JAJ0_PARAB|nr:NADH dehydrogenase subunit 5 [Paratenuisentis ambiguus]CCA94486.2 NADH dehydrogenase subunit 5 [Paratenuisentis ambiguus]
MVLVRLFLMCSWFWGVSVMSFEVFYSWASSYNIMYNHSMMGLSVLMVLIYIYLLVLFFSGYYMMSSKNFFSFAKLVQFFVVGMGVFLVFSDVYFTLIGWEVLGVVSFVLIFYYCNDSSKVSSFFTVLINRLGDFGLIIYLSFSLCYMSEYSVSSSMILGLFLCLISKSAQFPFSVWLPMAMSAPTPVSSLVHSSTLVTAGLILVMGYFGLFNSEMLLVCLYVGGFTLVVSAFSAVFESDMKKIVALSTLFHLGFMSSLFSLGCVDVSCLHLIFHGGFKSLLFVMVGLIILFSNHEQDNRYVVAKGLGSVVWVFFSLSAVSLVGVPYFSGSLTKEVFLSAFSVSGVNLVLYLFVVLSLGCSLAYTMKLFKGLVLLKLVNNQEVWKLKGLGIKGVMMGIFSFSGCLVVLQHYVLGGLVYLSCWTMVAFLIISLFIWGFHSKFVKGSLLSVLSGWFSFFSSLFMMCLGYGLMFLEESVMFLGLSFLSSGFSVLTSSSMVWFSFSGLFSFFVSGLVFMVL